MCKNIETSLSAFAFSLACVAVSAAMCPAAKEVILNLSKDWSLHTMKKKMMRQNIAGKYVVCC